MAKIKISDLDVVSQVDGQDLIEIVDVDDVTDGPTGTSKAIKLDNLSSKGLEEYDSNTDYEANQVVINGGIIYVANTEITGDGTGFDPVEWTELYDDRKTTSDIDIVGTTLGALSTGDTISTDLTLQQVLEQLTTKELFPTKTNPSGNLNVNNGKTEVGQEIELQLNVTINPGTLAKHKVNSNGNTVFINGSPEKTINAVVNGSGISTQNINQTLYTDQPNSETIAISPFTVPTSNPSFTLTGDYSDGAIPLTNLNKEAQDKQVLGTSSPFSNGDSLSVGYKVFYGFTDSPQTNELSITGNYMWDNQNNKRVSVQSKKYFYVGVPINQVTLNKVQQDTGVVGDLVPSNTFSFTRSVNGESYTLYEYAADTAAWDNTTDFIIKLN